MVFHSQLYGRAKILRASLMVLDYVLDNLIDAIRDAIYQMSPLFVKNNAFSDCTQFFSI